MSSRSPRREVWSSARPRSPSRRSKDVPDEELLEIAGEEGDDPAVAFRRTLGMFATGVTIITTQVGDQVHGMTANAFMSVSLRPPLVLVSVDKRAKMNALLHEGVRFGVNVLADDQRDLSDHFAGRADDRASEARFAVIHGTPLVDGALAHLVARAERSYWGGDHSLFLGRVEYARYGSGTPLLFHGGQYEQLLAKAPVFSTLSPELLEPILSSGEERAFADRGDDRQAGRARRRPLRDPGGTRARGAGRSSRSSRSGKGSSSERSPCSTGDRAAPTSSPRRMC